MNKKMFLWCILLIIFIACQSLILKKKENSFLKTSDLIEKMVFEGYYCQISTAYEMNDDSCSNFSIIVDQLIEQTKQNDFLVKRSNCESSVKEELSQISKEMYFLFSSINDLDKKLNYKLTFYNQEQRNKQFLEFAKFLRQIDLNECSTEME